MTAHGTEFANVEHCLPALYIVILLEHGNSEFHLDVPLRRQRGFVEVILYGARNELRGAVIPI